ncbi:MAG: FtsK/SpoIIIE domain-containing protein [Coprobacillaceae bacterium]
MGFVDIPEAQTQKDYTIDFLTDGNLALFASSGFGKSFTLGTIMTTLAVKNSPELLNYYIVDLGNSALIPYMNLPHTADYMNFDAVEKLVKFMKLMEDTIKECKKLLALAMVQNYETYNQMHEDDPLKAIIVFVDNYDVVKELGMDFEGFIMRLSRDGFGLGIYVVLTATRTNAIRYATLNNFKNKIAHYLYDKAEINAIVGRSQYDIPEIKGRSLIKLENINIMQVYTPFLFEDNVEFIQKLKDYIQQIKDVYKGQPLKGIPVLPEVFTSDQFNQYNSEENVEIKLGLCVQEVVTVDANIKGSPYVIIGPQKSGKTNTLELLMNQMINEGECHIFDSPEMRLYKYSKQDNVNYVSTDEELQDFVDDIYTEIEERREAFQEAMRQGSDMQGFYDQFPSVTVFIDETDAFVAKMEQKYKGFGTTLKEACTMGVKVIATASASKLKGFDELTKMFKVVNYGLVLGNQGTTTIFPIKSVKEYPNFGKGLLFDNGEYRRILIPKYVETKEDKA